MSAECFGDRRWFKCSVHDLKTAGGSNFGLDSVQTAEASAAHETLWRQQNDLLNSRAGGSGAGRLT